MTNKAKHIEARRDKRMNAVSRLTFIKGLKDVREYYVYDESSAENKKTNEEKNKKKKFNHWCMPSQQSGYIKCKAHDCL